MDDRHEWTIISNRATVVGVDSLKMRVVSVQDLHDDTPRNDVLDARFPGWMNRYLIRGGAATTRTGRITRWQWAKQSLLPFIHLHRVVQPSAHW